MTWSCFQKRQSATGCTITACPRCQPHGFARSDIHNEATITVNGFNPEPRLVPGNAQYYRVINHLSIISDYVYIEKNRRYEAISPLDQTAAFVYSDYMAVNTPLSTELKAAFPEGTAPGDSDTVLQCVGVEFYNRAGTDGYVLYSTGNMIVYDVF